jgi:hypothetical protein
MLYTNHLDFKVGLRRGEYRGLLRRGPQPPRFGSPQPVMSLFVNLNAQSSRRGISPSVEVHVALLGRRFIVE